MPLDNLTVEQRLVLANALARAEALVRANVQTSPVNYPADVETAISAAVTELSLVTVSGNS